MVQRVLVAGGTLVAPEGRRAADIVIEGERIEAILEPGTRVSADERHLVDGQLVFPGFIDPHVHSRDPGATEKEDFEHSTRAAAAGGLTTILEMPNAVPAVSDVSTFKERAVRHERVASVDFGLWGISAGRSNLEELTGLFGEGAVAVKCFWGYSLDRSTMGLVYDPRGRAPEDIIPPPELGDLLEACREVAAVGGVLAAHCEDSSILRAAQASLGREIETYDDLLRVRPEVAEAACVALGGELARATGCRFHVVHMASGRGVELVRDAQRQGIRLSAETCPHYLTLSAEDYEQIGPIVKVFPPIRAREDQDALWTGINDGTLLSIGSDHSPHTIEEKLTGLASAPAGSVGVETFANVMLDAAVAGRTSMERLAWVLAEGTARLYGLFPRKGRIQPGADADLTIVDASRTRTVNGDRLHSKQRYSPWQGVTLRGVPVLSFLRGQMLMRDGEPIGAQRGRFLRAKTNAPGRET